LYSRLQQPPKDYDRSLKLYSINGNVMCKMEPVVALTEVLSQDLLEQTGQSWKTVCQYSRFPLFSGMLQGNVGI
jgi:hypothetical protein